jgi:hypothetical protein
LLQATAASGRIVAVVGLRELAGAESTRREAGMLPHPISRRDRT